jgi:hypothetical protein
MNGVAAAARATRAQPARRSERERLAWYCGLAAMAAFDVIDWPVAVAIAVGHEVARRAHSRSLREFAEGIEAGA